LLASSALSLEQCDGFLSAQRRRFRTTSDAWNGKHKANCRPGQWINRLLVHLPQGRLKDGTP
jgi:hypothetical protein